MQYSIPLLGKWRAFDDQIGTKEAKLLDKSLPILASQIDGQIKEGVRRSEVAIIQHDKTRGFVGHEFTDQVTGDALMRKELS